MKIHPQHARKPHISTVKSPTAWLAALSPSISGLAGAVLGGMLWGNEADWSRLELLSLWAPRLLMIQACLLIDYAYLRRQGGELTALDVDWSTVGPRYLFSRAQALGTGWIYAVIWCASLAGEIVITLYRV